MPPLPGEDTGRCPDAAAVIRCPMCGKKFAIIPVDGYLEQYVEIMTDGGKAAANPEYL